MDGQTAPTGCRDILLGSHLLSIFLFQHIIWLLFMLPNFCHYLLPCRIFVLFHCFQSPLFSKSQGRYSIDSYQSKVDNRPVSIVSILMNNRNEFRNPPISFYMQCLLLQLSPRHANTCIPQRSRVSVQIISIPLSQAPSWTQRFS